MKTTLPPFCTVSALLSSSVLPAAAIDVGSQKQLFIDDKFIGNCNNVTLTVNPPVKNGVAIDTDMPWDEASISYTSLLKDKSGSYRAYYRCSEGGKEGKYGTGHFCLATSKDGITWEKPNLGLVVFRGSKDNNILPTIPWGHVFLDPEADSDRRYKFIGNRFFGHKDRGGVWLAYSSDGLNWTFNTHRSLPFGCDTFNLAMYDPRIDKYVAYLRGWNPDRPGRPRNRTVVRAEMNDILVPWPHKPISEKSWIYPSWPQDGPNVISYELPTVLELDEEDWPAETDSYADIYTPSVYIYPWAQDIYLAFITLYRHYQEPISWDGPVEIQLAVSRDGIHFARPQRKPYIRLGLPDEQDRGCVYPGQGMIRDGGKIYQYYAGVKGTHGEYTRMKEVRHQCKLMRATQRLDGFVSADFAYTGGTLTTPAITFEGKQLGLNIDCSAMGFGHVEIRDADGKPIPGYTLAECDTVALNHTARVVSWKGDSDLGDVKGPIKLHFAFRASKLYAFQFAAN